MVYAGRATVGMSRRRLHCGSRLPGAGGRLRSVPEGATSTREARPGVGAARDRARALQGWGNPIYRGGGGEGDHSPPGSKPVRSAHRTAPRLEVLFLSVRTFVNDVDRWQASLPQHWRQEERRHRRQQFTPDQVRADREDVRSRRQHIAGEPLRQEEDQLRLQRDAAGECCEAQCAREEPRQASEQRLCDPQKPHPAVGGGCARCDHPQLRKRRLQEALQGRNAENGRGVHSIPPGPLG